MQVGAAAIAILCAGAGAGADGATRLSCDHAEGAEPDAAMALCDALAAAMDEREIASDGLRLEVTAARDGLVAARLHRQGVAGPLVQLVAMDGPLLPDWPARLAHDLLQAVPAP